MARQVHWQIPFYMRGETGLLSRCTINIHEDNYSGTTVILNGGVEPVVISEDNNSDAFTPVRISSGNISIIAQSDISAIFPVGITSRYVTIKRGTTLLWQGYLKTSNNDMVWDRFPVDIQLSAISCLGILGDIKIPVPNNSEFGLQRLRAIIKKAFDASGTSATIFMYPMEWDNGDILDSLVNDFAFFSEPNIPHDSPNYSRYIGKTYLEILEEIMTFLGWTLYERGDNAIIATSLGCGDYYSVQISELADENPDKAEVESRTVPLGTLSPIAGSDHNQSVVRPIKNITVETEIKKNDAIEIDLSPDNYGINFGSKFTLGASHGIPVLASKNLSGYVMDIDTQNCNIIPYCYSIPYIKNPIDDEWEFDSEEGVREEDMSASDFVSFTDGENPYGSTWQTHYGAMLFHGDCWNDSTGKTKYDYSDALLVVESYLHIGAQSYVTISETILKENPILYIQSKKAIYFKDGILVIKSNFWQNITGGRTDFLMKLKVGNKYYHRNTVTRSGYWDTTEEWFNIYLGTNDKTSYDVYEDYNDATGMIISSLGFETAGGIIEIWLTPTRAAASSFGSIKDFSVGTMLPDLYGGEARKDNNKYYATNQVEGSDREISLNLFTMNNNSPASNVLWWNSYSGLDYLTTQLDSGLTPVRPEVGLINKVKTQFSTKRKLIDVTVQFINVSPHWTILVDNVLYQILARKHNYADKTTRLTLLEIQS